MSKFGENVVYEEYTLGKYKVYKIKVPSGQCQTLFEHPDYGGDMVVHLLGWGFKKEEVIDKFFSDYEKGKIDNKKQYNYYGI